MRGSTLKRSWTERPLTAVIILSLVIIGTEVALSHPDLLGSMIEPDFDSRATGTMLSASKMHVSSVKGGGFQLNVRYRFDAGGKEMVGSRYFWASHLLAEGDADARLSELQPGATVDVRYQSDSPANAVLAPDPALGWIPGTIPRRAIELVLIALLISAGVIAERRGH